MKRAEFIKTFIAHREQNGEKQVKAGTVRLSEHVMGLACAPADAARIWAKHRATFAPMDRAQFFKFMGWDLTEQQSAPKPAPKPLDPRMVAIQQLDFTMQWHLEKAIGYAILIHNEPIRSNLLLLKNNLEQIRTVLS